MTTSRRSLLRSVGIAGLVGYTAGTAPEELKRNGGTTTSETAGTDDSLIKRLNTDGEWRQRNAAMSQSGFSAVDSRVSVVEERQSFTLPSGEAHKWIDTSQILATSDAVYALYRDFDDPVSELERTHVPKESRSGIVVFSQGCGCSEDYDTKLVDVGRNLSLFAVVNGYVIVSRDRGQMDVDEDVWVDNETYQARELVAVSEETGETEWRVPFGSVIRDGGKNSDVREQVGESIRSDSGVIVNGKSLLVGTTKGVYRIDVETGEVVWEYEGETVTGIASNESTVVFSSGRYGSDLKGLAVETGEMMWHERLDESVSGLQIAPVSDGSDRVVYTAEEVSVVFMDGEGRVESRKVETGEVERERYLKDHSVDGEKRYFDVRGVGVVDGSVVIYVTFEDARMHYLSAIRVRDGVEEWTQQIRVASSVSSGQSVCGFLSRPQDNRSHSVRDLRVLNSDDGTTVFEDSLSTHPTSVSSPIRVENRLYVCRPEDGEKGSRVEIVAYQLC